MGIRVMMLTGDAEAVARSVAGQLGLDEYFAVAIPLAAGVLYREGVVLSPAVGAALMALSTVFVAINARLLRFQRRPA